MIKDTADYEESEQVAIDAGKTALSRSPWLFNRDVSRSGFFVTLKCNDIVHSNHFSVHCVDGVGTKLFLSPWSNNYFSTMLDGVRMNSNDLATIINAYPSEVDIYLACQTEVEEKHMGDIMEGVRRGLEEIRVPWAPFDLNIGKLETASLDEMISLGVRNKGFDVGIVMTGYIEKKKLPNLNPKPGDLIVGVSSTGLHSNSYTGARHVIFTPDVEYRDEWKSQYKGKYVFNDRPSILEGQTVLEAMLVPTASYFPQASKIGKELDDPKIYGINITGNGLYNFNRAGDGVSFEITDPLDPLPVHNFLVQESKWDAKTAYTKQNGGMGFAYICPKNKADAVVKIIGDKAKVVGEVVRSRGKELRTTLHENDIESGRLDFIGYSN